MRYYARCLLVTAFVLMLALLLSDPGSHAVVNFVGEALPPTLLLSLLLGSPKKPVSAAERRRKERDEAVERARKAREELEQGRELARKRAELEADTPFWGELARHNAIMARLNTGLKTGTFSRDEARALWGEARGLYQPHHCDGKFYANYTFCPEHGANSPAAQLEKLSQQYGLDYTLDILEDYGPSVITEPKKPGLPPVGGISPKHAYEVSSKQLYHLGVASGELSPDELEVLRARFTASLGKPLIVLPPEPAEEVPEPESVDDYVPAGQDELVRELKRVMDKQVREAQRTTWSAQRKREWHMNDEWYELACLVYLPGSQGHLYGYPVAVGVQYGVPELCPV